MNKGFIEMMKQLTKTGEENRMTKVYKTLLDAERELPLALGELSHGGQKEVFAERHALGYVIAEFKVIDGEHIFQRYYKGE